MKKSAFRKGPSVAHLSLFCLLKVKVLTCDMCAHESPPLPSLLMYYLIELYPNLHAWCRFQGGAASKDSEGGDTLKQVTQDLP